MKPIVLFRRFINWLASFIFMLGDFIDWLLSFRLNCSKGRHDWGYQLSEAGRVYRNDKDVPKELWSCGKCNVKKKT